MSDHNQEASHCEKVWKTAQEETQASCGPCAEVWGQAPGDEAAQREPLGRPPPQQTGPNVGLGGQPRLTNIQPGAHTSITLTDGILLLLLLLLLLFLGIWRRNTG